MARPTPARRAWHVLPLAPREFFAEMSGHPPLVAQVLYNRGLRTPGDAEAFLHPYGTSSSEGLRLPGADAAVRRIARAVREQEPVAVFGDFDADGLTASAVLTLALRGLGASPLAYIPDRVAEGHGLNLDAVQRLHQRGVRLIITADCGITSTAEVAAAADLGIDTVVTDHHSPPPELPPAAAVVNPKLSGAPGVYSALASVGVAYKLCQAVYDELGRSLDQQLLQLVALGTVADLSPLAGENRYLVQQGLGHLNNSPCPGVRALLRVSGVAPGTATAETIAYALAPRINAPGRTGQATPSYQLLVASSEAEAWPLAQELDARNAERRAMTERVQEQVRQKIAGAPPPPIFVVGGEDFPAGIVGLAASKLTEEFSRPAVVYQQGALETRASCRSVPEFNIIEALHRCNDLFTRYGGHAQAAGFTMPTANLPALHLRLTALAQEALAGLDLTPRLTIDAQVRLERITGDVLLAMAALEPHGRGNPAPTFVARNVELLDPRPMGNGGKHLRLKVRSGGVSWPAVAFNATTPPGTSSADVVFTLSTDRWGGAETIRLNVLDMAAPA